MLYPDSQTLLSESDRTITGFNMGINSGESASQTIFHANIHLIPRRDGAPRSRGVGSEG